MEIKQSGKFIIYSSTGKEGFKVLELQCACGHQLLNHEYHHLKSPVETLDLLMSTGKCKRCACTQFRLPEERSIPTNEGIVVAAIAVAAVLCTATVLAGYIIWTLR